MTSSARMAQNLRLLAYQPLRIIIILRSVIILCAFGYYFISKQGVLLPHGPPVVEPPARDPSAPSSVVVVAKTDALRFRHGRTYIVRAPGIVGPETIVLWRDRVFCLTDKLLELTNLPTAQEELDLLSQNENMYVWNATSVERNNLGIGRPLGGRFHANTLYIADAVLGLTRLRNVDNPDSNVELLTSQVTVLKQSGNSSYTQVNSPLLFVNSVAVGPVTNKIYFTDSTDIPPDRIWKKDRYVWDILYPSKLHLARGKPTGRLCEYNPATGITRVLADNIHFANGVAVDPVHEEYLIVAESAGIHVLKYNLSSVKKTTELLTPNNYLQPEVLATSLPGYPDNVDCAVISGQTTQCFVAIVADVAAVHVAWKYMPFFAQKFLRTILMIVPRSWLPEFRPRYTGILMVDPVTGEKDYIQDPSGKDLSLLTGVTVSPNNGKLYLGSLHNDYVGVHLLSSGSRESSPSPSRFAGKEEL